MFVQHVSPDAMLAVAGHVNREYGYSGYSIGIAAASLGAGVFEVSASDGSQFELISDRYGNVTRPEQTLDGGDNR